MKRTQKKLLISFSLLSAILLTTGCAPKNADGSYNSRYSYHPYMNGQQGNNTVGRRIENPNYRVSSSRVSNNIEHVAKSLLGTDYQYGANGPHQYDCSSFTKYVFSRQGINIPRVSRDQAKVGQYVSYSNLKKGDLVFFDTHKKKTGKVTHVGIYLGAGNFIHASSGAKKIVIFNFNEKKFYKNRFLWARRVIKNDTHLAMK